MSMVKVIEWVDVTAPRAEVFALVMDIERRMQLSPLWGVARVVEVSPEFPQVGSTYCTRTLREDEVVYQTTITALTPGRKFAYAVDVDRQTQVTWMVQDTPGGTRLTYQEEYLAQDGDGEEFVPEVRKVVKQWLGNIKRYSELRDTRMKRLTRRAVDRFYLKLPSDQRKVIQTVLFMQVLGTLSFMMAAIAYGFASLL